MAVYAWSGCQTCCLSGGAGSSLLISGGWPLRYLRRGASTHSDEQETEDYKGLNQNSKLLVATPPSPTTGLKGSNFIA